MITQSKFLDRTAMPHFWCEGCGNGIVLQALIRSLDALKLDPEKTVVVTGIGCTGKLDDYVACHTVHGTHGRALPIATGIKAANPELTVIAVLGDGDGATIGGNHLLHTARRNIGVTAILINNMNYGMTGGQYSGTTPLGSKTSTSPYGDPEPAMDLCRVVEAAGANFVARSTVYHAVQLQRYIQQALTKPGFSFIEAVSTCPTYYGRFNGRATPAEMLLSFRDRAVALGGADAVVPPGYDGKFAIGVFSDKMLDGFSERYEKVRDSARKTQTAVVSPATISASASSSYWEIVMAGSGGQGLGLAGLLVGQAAVEYGGLQSSQTQAYGTAARGGFAKSELIISSGDIDYPGVTEPNFVICLSKEAYEKYSGKVPDDCWVVFDSDETGMTVSGKPKEAGFAMGSAAKAIGEPQSANLVALGVLVRHTGMMAAGPVEKAIASRFPGKPGPLSAFREGMRLVEASGC
jgi:2-oxoglutarate/2-oxoacid ferredoxin oxidoreductase subunit beta